jgi:hypothetical protein
MAFRSQMFIIGDLVKPNFNSTQQYGIGVVVGVDDSSINPRVVVLWPNKDGPMNEHFQDIIRVDTDE